MKNKSVVIAVIVTALVTCHLTNTVRDIQLSKGNFGVDRKVKTVMDVIKNYSIYDFEAKKMGDDTARTIVSSLGDVYSNYFSKEEYESLMTDIQTSYTGVGMTIGADIEKNKLIIIAPVEGQPADKAGILSGDYIIAVDGVEYSAEQMNEAVAKIKGIDIPNADGTNVVLTIERNGEKKDYTLTRGIIVRESVTSKKLDNDIGYLRINQFCSKDVAVKDSKDTYDEFVENINSLGKINSLIIDLRDNPGGSLDVVTKIADYLLPEGIITYTEDKNGKKQYYNSDENSLNKPIAVLVNGGSASASEVLSGALKDYKKATLIGEKTFGKGVVQTVIPLYDGSGMTITSAKYYTPSGICIHEKGIMPDEVIKLKEEKSVSQLTPDEDVQLKKAIEVLTK